MGLAHSRPQPKRLGVSEPVREYKAKSPAKKPSPKRRKDTPKRTKKKGKK